MNTGILKTHFFTVPWKSHVLTQQNLDNIKDKDNSTRFTMNKAECSYIELWAENLGWKFHFIVNISGKGNFVCLIGPLRVWKQAIHPKKWWKNDPATKIYFVILPIAN